MMEQILTGSLTGWYGKYLWSIKHPQIMIMTYLVPHAYKPHIHTCIQTRRTPMLEACQRGHTEIAKLLLIRGAHPNWRARVTAIL